MPISSLDIAMSVAIAFVWARGSLFARLRELPRLAPLLDCPLCSGWWIGALCLALRHHSPLAFHVLGFASLVGALSLAWYGIVRRI